MRKLVEAIVIRSSTHCTETIASYLMSDKSPDEQSEAPIFLAADLLYETPPTISAELLCERLSTAMPRSKLISKESSEALLIVHEDHDFQLSDGEIIQPCTAIAKGGPVDRARLLAPLHQTWDWPEAPDVVGRAAHQLIVAEMLARVFEPQVRVTLFFNVLLQIMEMARPIAIHCQHAERIVDPSKIIRASGSAELSERMRAFLNVRLFRIDGASAGDLIMDTRGLAALGLPDLQMHFRKLEPGRVAALLYNSALYVYQNGDRIQNGHTIQGLGPQDQWRCQHENSLLEPRRVVIDIDAGEPFAAGNRHRP